MDKGTNMFETKRLVDASDRLLHLKEVKDQPLDVQYRNYCERLVQILKKIIRMMCRTLKIQKLPLLEKEDATLLIKTACFQVNSIPYAADNEDLCLSPNDILVPSFQMDSLATASSPLHKVNVLIKKLKVYHVEIKPVMEHTFLKDWRRYSPSSLRVHKAKKNLRPEEGDLVLVKGDKMNDMGHYGIVNKVVSIQTVLVKLKGGGKIERAVGQTIPLVPQCILKGYCVSPVRPFCDLSVII